MDFLTLDLLSSYWTSREMGINLVIFANLVGALLLGLVVGYERSYHGRAAGMRTYAIVCMASCAVTIIAGFPGAWFGGAESLSGHITPDPTRVIQGILTGVGFLGAGVITKDSNNISGLTTAASIWSASAIGIMVGVGFYVAATLFTALSVGLMIWTVRLEMRLPTRPSITVTMRFKKGFRPVREVLRRVAEERGYSMSESSLQIKMRDGQQEWHFNASAKERRLCAPVTQLADELAQFDGVEEFSVSTARN